MQKPSDGKWAASSGFVYLVFLVIAVRRRHMYVFRNCRTVEYMGKKENPDSGWRNDKRGLTLTKKLTAIVGRIPQSPYSRSNLYLTTTPSSGVPFAGLADASMASTDGSFMRNIAAPAM